MNTTMEAHCCSCERMEVWLTVNCTLLSGVMMLKDVSAGSSAPPVIILISVIVLHCLFWFFVPVKHIATLFGKVTYDWSSLFPWRFVGTPGSCALKGAAEATMPVFKETAVQAEQIMTVHICFLQKREAEMQNCYSRVSRVHTSTYIHPKYTFKTRSGNEIGHKNLLKWWGHRGCATKPVTVNQNLIKNTLMVTVWTHILQPW